ncbi:MAG: helix-turn-helix domain-containing protein [Thermoleophilaceae bacterium]
MPSIGETLREARMRQRLDITDVEARTKIRAKYLRALENEDFGMLPGATFVKSFLRTYAEFLGLDPHLLVEEYRARHDPRDESELTPFAPRPSARGRRPAPPRAGPWLGGVLAVVGILALLLILGLTGGSNDNGGSKQTASTTHTTTHKKARPHRRRHRRAARVHHSVKLRIAPASPTYVCVDRGAGTSVVFEGTLARPRSFRGRHLRINLGRREVRLSSNGKRVRVPGGTDPIGFDFRPDKAKEMPAGQKRPCG